MTQASRGWVNEQKASASNAYNMQMKARRHKDALEHEME
jgi:hypothetical protein